MSQCILLTLPLELRERIYSFLLPSSPTSHPLPSVGLTSVSHALPTSALLNIHPQIADEILEYFYTITTWKLIFSHAFNFFRVDPDLKGLERSHALARVKKVELVFYCDVLLLQDYTACRMEEAFCMEIRRRAERACEVLVQAERLRCVVVSWIDTTAQTYSLETGPGQKSAILSPLRKLLDRPGMPVELKIGHVTESSRAWFIQAMRDLRAVTERDACGGDDRSLVSKSPSLDAGSTADEKQATNLRMLAFDVRQERHLLHREQEEALYWGRGIPRRLT